MSEQDAPRLDERLDRLEAIVARLGREDIELEEALRLFEEGVTHLRAAQELVKTSELRIMRLLDDGAGGSLLEPMGPAEP